MLAWLQSGDPNTPCLLSANCSVQPISACEEELPDCLVMQTAGLCKLNLARTA